MSLFTNGTIALITALQARRITGAHYTFCGHHIANEVNFSEEKLELQHRKRDWVYIQKSSIEFATKTGQEEGLQQGKIEATRQIVLNLAKEKVPIEVIQTSTGLTKEEIEKILAE